MSYTIIDTTSEGEWLAARREFVTATDIARLASGGPATWALVRSEKHGTDQGFHGNAYTEWGKEREAAILAHLGFLYGVEPNPDHRLLTMDGTRWAGTPDGMSATMLAEAKTTGTDWVLAVDSLPTKYLDQVAWCQMVADVGETAFGWEVREGRPGSFVAGPTRTLIIPRDDERIKRLVETAEKFLSTLDTEVESGEWDDLIAAESVARADLDKAQAEVSRLDDLIRERAGESEVAAKSEFGSISLAWPKPRSTFDSAALKKADPDMYGRFVRITEPTKPTLRVSVK